MSTNIQKPTQVSKFYSLDSLNIEWGEIGMYIVRV